MGSDRRSRLTGEREWILEPIEQVPDLTIEELRDQLKAHGVVIGYGLVWRFFAREDVTLKKCVAEQELPDVAEARMRWQHE